MASIVRATRRGQDAPGELRLGEAREPLFQALGGRVAILEDMIVDREARGRGLGARLMTEAIRVCQADGCLRITLLTDGDNAAARRFYRRFDLEYSPMVALRRVFAVAAEDGSD